MAHRIFKTHEYNVTQMPGIDISKTNTLSKEADALVVRSYDLHELKFGGSLKAIGRAGAGTNNIPLDRCSEEGVVVFNTPGANANAVKELVLCGLFLSSRDIVGGVNWTTTQKGKEDVAKLVEKNKKQFKGSEIRGKTLGVVGLGAIGMLIANDALNLGMHVIGYDPYLSVDNAWKLSSDVRKATSMEEMLRLSDFVTLHIPSIPETRGSINAEKFSMMKSGARLLNYSRADIVNIPHLLSALASGRLGAYVTDFPVPELIGVDKVIHIPHLGASTAEAEDNCAEMVAEQIISFMEHGNIKNSVNFPNCSLDRNGGQRLTIINKNMPGLMERYTMVIADIGLNIEGMINKSRGAYAYNILDLDSEITLPMIEGLEAIDGVIRVRKI
ncbi:MAG: phosphoglycerate dehydrogenase [archaeon]